VNSKEYLELERGRKLFERALGRRGVAENREMQFSKGIFPDGENYTIVDTDQHLFDGVDLKKYPKIAKRIILNKYKGQVIGVEPDSAYVNKISANEYAYPAKRNNETSIKNAKMKASTELHNLVETGKKIGHENDDGRHPEAIGGWDKYKSTFRIEDRFFQGELSIMITKRGRVFYDMTKIKDITNGTIDQYGGIPQAESVPNTFNPIILLNGQNGNRENNTQYSIKNEDTGNEPNATRNTINTQTAVPEILNLMDIHNQIKNGDQIQLNRIYGEYNKEDGSDGNRLKYQGSKIPYSDSAAKVIPKEIKQGIDTAIKKMEKDFQGLKESIRSIKLNEQLEEAAQIRITIRGDGTVTRDLELNPVMWSSREKLAAEYKKILDKKIHAPSDDPYSIIVHEMGHVIHQNVALRKTGYFLSGKLSREQISMFNFEMKKITQECYIAAFTDETFYDIEQIVMKELGILAAKMPTEFIADSFTSVYSMNSTSPHAKLVVEYLKRRI
jgi:hypothetical protein